ncbi:hypothetical protein [Nonomuraea sp. KM90]|uniref:hypothetical protein n=1 Tax=Nonomuraea sp. KM90 TaxID=3457428 RepID=UPI003FCCE5F7
MEVWRDGVMAHDPGAVAERILGQLLQPLRLQPHAVAWVIDARRALVLKNSRAVRTDDVGVALVWILVCLLQL